MTSNGIKKILIFSTDYLPRIGGAELAVRNITDRLDGFDFDLITSRLDKSLPKQEKNGRVNVFRMGSGGFYDKFFLHRLGYAKAISLQSFHGYDLIWSLMASYGGVAAYRFKKKFNHIPMLLNLQEGRDFSRINPPKSYVFKKIVSNSDKIVAISGYLSRIAVQSGADKKNVKIIPNGVDVHNFTREFSYGELSDLNDRLGIKPDDKIIISASRLIHKNGLDDLIRAIRLVTDQETQNSYKLILAGLGGDFKKLKQLVRELGLVNKVIFLGHVDHADLPRYFRIAHIFARPSRSEGLGSAFLEAMAAGLPVIATPVGGIPDFLTDGETGLFCKLNNPQSIADRIKLILSDHKLHNKLIANSYKVALKKYDWQKIAEEYQLLLNSMING